MNKESHEKFKDFFKFVDELEYETFDYTIKKELPGNFVIRLFEPPNKDNYDIVVIKRKGNKEGDFWTDPCPLCRNKI